MGTAGTLVKTLVVTDLVDSTALLARLGDERGSHVFARCDRAARSRLAEFGGQEVDKTDGFLLLFDRPIDACRYVIAYHADLAALSAETGVGLSARAGIHLGEVVLRENAPEDIARGAKAIEVEGLAKPATARLASLAQGRQTLLTKSAFELTRRAAVSETLSDEPLQWLAHGPYLFKGFDEPLEVFEVGVVGFAPLAVPADSEKVRRAVAAGDETTLGWRPAPGQEIPHRSGWIVREKLGEGGFGEAWLADNKQTGDQRVFKFCFQAERLRSLRREVMLFRLMKEGLGNRDDIAQVLDWQFDEPPYFLEAEYTSGGSFIQWAADQGGLDHIPLPTRLELIAQVAVALSAAHSVGVLHKDIKPANVLIATDGQGLPKARLTDFGIGLVQDREQLLEKGITAYDFTRVMSPGSESTAGTHMYMAPELIEGKVASVQADIYALGVMLYQVVVGDFGRALTSNWIRDIDDDLLREDIAALVDGSPAHRLANAADIAERLRTLAPRRAERAEEQRRRDEAAAAHLILERAQRRRKLVTIFAGVGGVVLLVVSVLAVQAVRARGDADFRRNQAEDLIGFMLGDLRAKLTPVGRLDVLDGVGRKALEYFAAIPASAVTDADQMRHAKTLSQIGEVRMDQGKLSEALELFQQSLRIAAEVTARNPAVAEWQVALGASHFWVGDALRRQSDLQGALQHWQTYLEISKALTERHPDHAEYRLELGYAYNNLGTLWEAQGDLQGGLQAFRDSLAISQQLAALDPGHVQLQHELAKLHNKIARVMEKQGDLQGALKSYANELTIREALAVKEPANMEWKFWLATNHELLGRLLQIMGQGDAGLMHLLASRNLVQSLTERDPANTTWRRLLAVSHRNTAVALLRLGRQDDSARLLEGDRAFLERYTVANPTNAVRKRDLASIHLAIGEYQLRQGNPGGAAAAIGSAIAILDGLLQKDPEDEDAIGLLSDAQNALGSALAGAGRKAEAAAAWTRAGQLVEAKARGSSDWRLLDPWARSLMHLGRVQEAAPVVSRLVASGYREPRFLDLCRQRGLPVGSARSPGSAKPNG